MTWGSRAKGIPDKDAVYTCTKGSVGPITVPADGSPPRASLIDGNGCNMYGLCNIMVVTLLQANDQIRTGTCGMQAMYASLAKINPAKAPIIIIQSLVFTIPLISSLAM